MLRKPFYPGFMRCCIALLSPLSDSKVGSSSSYVNVGCGKIRESTYSHSKTFPKDRKTPMILFPENTHLKIEQVSQEKTLTVLIRSTEATSTCTYCGIIATQIHSRYRRHLSDFPVSGYPVTVRIEVRRFFCRHPSCPRKTFAETLEPFAGRYAQRTNRLQEQLQQLGLDLGAQVGAKTAVRLGLASSPSSLFTLDSPSQSVLPSTTGNLYWH